MGTEKDTYIADLRVYEDPNNPETSNYDVVLPVTSTDAVIDSKSNKTLSTILNETNSSIAGEINEGNNINLENKQAIEEISKKIGDSTTGSSNTGTNLFSLIKWIVNKFVSIWTDTRASKLDNLDTSVSSRAPASTALSNATWTNARASNLDTTISSRAVASTALSNTVWTNARAAKLDTITTNSDKIGVSTNGASSTGTTLFSLIKWLVNKTTGVWTDARATKLDKIDAMATNMTTMLNKPFITNSSVIKSIQRGTIVVAGAGNVISTERLITITAININKASVNFISYAPDKLVSIGVFLYLKSNNTLAYRLIGGQGTSANIYFSWEVIEHY